MQFSDRTAAVKRSRRIMPLAMGREGACGDDAESEDLPDECVSDSSA